MVSTISGILFILSLSVLGTLLIVKYTHNKRNKLLKEMLKNKDITQKIYDKYIGN
jgi:hypothetical protein